MSTNATIFVLTLYKKSLYLKAGIRVVFFISCLFPFVGYAQGQHAIPLPVTDSSDKADIIITSKYNSEYDLIDLGRRILYGAHRRMETGQIKSGKLRTSIVPAAGYTLQTGFAGILAANATFYTDKTANESTVLTSLTYTARNQVLLPFQTSIWTRHNKYNIIIDWRYLYFPSYTYGLGGQTSITDGYIVNYSSVNLNQAVLRRVMDNMYVGLGYNFNYYWDIKELNPPINKLTDFETYGFSKTELASGATFNFLYDTRDNPVNAEKGSFVKLVYRINPALFGNKATWHSLVLDVRKYIKFPAKSDNVIALWSYNWFTPGGKPPYLMLPNTGGDAYSNTGRGYIQGRFRGSNMVYVEGEYRFRLTHNGLLGGVVFGNAESFTEQASNEFETIAPGCGVGLRLKFNKFSRTNVAIDYGIGTGGSGGLFVNVGEVF